MCGQKECKWDEYTYVCFCSCLWGELSVTYCFLSVRIRPSPPTYGYVRGHGYPVIREKLH
jgi:hypothetical protein